MVPATGASRVLTSATGACGRVFYSPHEEGTTPLLDTGLEHCVSTSQLLGEDWHE